MKDKPLITIISIMYNAELYIGRTLVSVLKQNYPNWEWIVVNDGSTDKSLSIISQMKDPRIRIINQKKHLGQAKGKNAGLDNAKGDYILFLDFNGELDTNFLKEQLSFMKDHSPIITSSYRRKTKDSISNFIVPSEIDLKTVLKGNPISCLTTMYDFDVFKDKRFDENIAIYAEFMFWVNIIQEGYTVYGNVTPLATLNYEVVENAYARRRMVYPLYKMYRKELHYGVFKSLHYLLSTIRFSIKKYKKVK